MLNKNLKRGFIQRPDLCSGFKCNKCTFKHETVENFGTALLLKITAERHTKPFKIFSNVLYQERILLDFWNVIRRPMVDEYTAAGCKKKTHQEMSVTGEPSPKDMDAHLQNGEDNGVY